MDKSADGKSKSAIIRLGAIRDAMANVSDLKTMILAHCLPQAVIYVGDFGCLEAKAFVC